PRFRKPAFTVLRITGRSLSAASSTSACRRSRRSVSPAGCCMSRGSARARGPASSEVNARMGGGRIHQIVDAVWGVDLIEAHMRAALGLRQQLAPSRKPRCAVVHALVYAPATGRLTALPFGDVTPEAGPGLFIDVSAEVGERVDGPDQLFSTVLAEGYVGAKNPRCGRALVGEVLHEPPVGAPLAATAWAAGPL